MPALPTNLNNDTYLPVPLRKQYKVVRYLGKGTYGLVHEISDRHNNQHFAIKAINIQGAVHRRYTENEVEILKLMLHPNILRFVDSYDDVAVNRIWIITEFCGGGSLEDIIESQKRKGQYLPETTVMKFLGEIVRGLHYLHVPAARASTGAYGLIDRVGAHQVLHRDLKPANIFIDHNGVVKIGDLGFARFFEAEQLRATDCGTPYTKAPEVARKEEYGAPADIWSVGCILFELLSLQWPFDVDVIGSKFSPAFYRFPVLPKGVYPGPLQDLLDQMLDLDPANRPTTGDLLNIYPIQLALRDVDLDANVRHEALRKREVAVKATEAKNKEVAEELARGQAELAALMRDMAIETNQHGKRAGTEADITRPIAKLPRRVEPPAEPHVQAPGNVWARIAMAFIRGVH